MPLRRRAWLSREGWYYCGVLAFIVGGAVLRSINLLVILAGMMIAPLAAQLAARDGRAVGPGRQPQIAASRFVPASR